MHIPKTAIPLLGRMAVFLGLFVVLSGVLGSRVVGGGIVYRDGFAIYGGLGKAAIFGLIAFGLLVRHKGFELRLRAWRPPLLGWLAAGAMAYGLAWWGVDGLLAGDRTAINLGLAHSGLILSVVLSLMGCIGPVNLAKLWRAYKPELSLSAALSVVFYLFLLAVYALWQPLATVVLHSVRGLLGLSGLSAIFVPPYTLMFDKFSITVAQYCSGVESIALFSSLYALVGLLDWPKLNKRRYLAVFPGTLLVLFGLNILRVFGLVLAGYHINQALAFSLFHSYAGMIFFIAYSAAFWVVGYKYLLDSAKVKA